MPDKCTFHIPQNELWIHRMLNWSNEKFRVYAYFRNNDVIYPHQGFEHSFFGGRAVFSLETAKLHYGKKAMVGIIAYDYKNSIELLESNNLQILELPETLFFQPELEIRIDKKAVTILHKDPEQIWQEILDFPDSNPENPSVAIQALTDHQTYLENVKSIQNHIEEGDIYELNYCMGFTFENQNWNPVTGFWDLMQHSPMPFSAFFRTENQYLICASPERFLRKDGNKLFAQPIKGTLKRGRDAGEDLIFRDVLQKSEKERAENLMIVDLMRNDLSKISETGSVTVEELFGVYPFPRVWQMISTVSSLAKEDVSLESLINATFPMGSMTGAPKIKCMELIEQYENFKRGWFSGTVGYIEANGNLDFNVIIRSILFDRENGKGFFAVGSAITYDGDAEYEYQECFLKASAILNVLKKEY